MLNPVLDAARELGPSIQQRADEIEQAGTLPLDLVDAIRPSGAFRQYVPDDLNGPGVTAWQSLEAIEELAYHDGAVGWCAAIGSTTSLASSYLPEQYAVELFADANAIGGGFAAPRGHALPVEGGLRVSGHWQWGSGIKHCTTIGGGCLVVDASGKPTPREDGLASPFVFFDPADVEILETWDVMGLAGTGSVDYKVKDVFVPEGRWVQLGVDPPRRSNPWGQFSFFGLLASCVAASAVGIGRRALDEATALATAKVPQGSRNALAARAPVQAEIAQCEARLASAWAFLHEAVEAAWQSALAGRESTPEERRKIRLAATHATQTAADVAASMFRVGGGVAVYRTSVLQRCFRDTAVAAQHAMAAPRTFEIAGRMRLGLETNLAMF